MHLNADYTGTRGIVFRRLCDGDMCARLLWRVPLRLLLLLLPLHLFFALLLPCKRTNVISARRLKAAFVRVGHQNHAPAPLPPRLFTIAHCSWHVMG